MPSGAWETTGVITNMFQDYSDEPRTRKIKGGVGMSKEIGILFKGEMVRAILEGRKTQTRRILKCDAPQSGRGRQFVQDLPREWRPEISMAGGENGSLQFYRWIPHQQTFYAQRQNSPWKAGDYLYVRETWGVGTRPDPFQGCVDGIEYRADQEYLDENDLLPINPVEGFDYEKYQGRGWMPSLFMFKSISRIWLKVTNVRVERLLDISEDDAIAEGILSTPGGGKHNAFFYDCVRDEWTEKPIRSYLSLWDSINGEDSHRSNPWCWVVEFERVEKP
jgi:hypothetical protein